MLLFDKGKLPPVSKGWLALDDEVWDMTTDELVKDSAEEVVDVVEAESRVVVSVDVVELVLAQVEGVSGM